jgi:methylase of polypeptide subunit release factors
MKLFTVKIRVQGHDILLKIPEKSVFVPNLMSYFSAARMHVRPGEIFCDVGTGSGLHAILAVKLGAKLSYGVDISPTVLPFARANARLNGVERACRFFAGSLVKPLVDRKIRVDAMIYNAPQFPGTAMDPSLPGRLKQSVNGGPGGGDLNVRFLKSARRALAPHGRIYNPMVGWAQPELTRKAMAEGGYRIHEVARVHVPSWGRGNLTREWLLERPGRHVFRYRHPAGRDTTAHLFELRLDGARAVAPKKTNVVSVDFRALR